MSSLSKWNKQAKQRADDIEKTRRLLKQFLFALHKSEGFGENRLLRVLIEWSEVYQYVNDPKNNANDEMMMIDRILDQVTPSAYVAKTIGHEKLLDNKGRPVVGKEASK